jgi:predicted N-acetyltransferase YhbS
MTKMALQIRQVQPDDAEELLKLYQRFVLNFVGSSARILKTFQRMTRRKDNLRWVALGEQGKIIGYVNATYAKGRRTGRILEIIVDPEHNFTYVARLLAEKLHSILIEKGAAVIQAASIRNPLYSQIFPKLGFFVVETDGVFMFAITDVAKFLDEISPIIVRRLQRLPNWDGLLQLTCQENNKFYKKHGGTVQTLLSTNHNPDYSISLNANTLIGILLGVTDAQKAWTEKALTIQTLLSKKETNELLAVLFPKQQFLALDYW